MRNSIAKSNVKIIIKVKKYLREIRGRQVQSVNATKVKKEIGMTTSKEKTRLFFVTSITVRRRTNNHPLPLRAPLHP
jgi:hypothetical protein